MFYILFSTLIWWRRNQPSPSLLTSSIRVAVGILLTKLAEKRQIYFCKKDFQKNLSRSSIESPQRRRRSLLVGCAAWVGSTASSRPSTNFPVLTKPLLRLVLTAFLSVTRSRSAAVRMKISSLYRALKSRLVWYRPRSPPNSQQKRENCQRTKV